MVEHIERLIERLEQYYGTELHIRALRSIAGTRYRQTGQDQAAYEQLFPAASQSLTDTHVVHAQAEMALLLFNAGYWEEAHEYALKAAGDSLLVQEDIGGFIAYAIACLVPAARGELDPQVGIIARLEETKSQHGPAVHAIVDWVFTWHALAREDYGTAAIRLLEMRNNSRGWWTIGIEPIVILGRTLHYSGWPEMIPSLLRSLKSEAAIGEGVSSSVADYLKAFELWGQGQPEQAADRFMATLRYFDAEPPVRPTQVPGEGGGCRIYRALLALDLAMLFQDYPEQLRRHRSAALELVVWAASVFQSSGAKQLLAEATHLMNSLRPRSFEAPKTPTGVVPRVDASLLAGVAEPGLAAGDLLSELSPREREIAQLVGRGCTNREAAEELVISVRTVEYHVANILSKLDLGSRKELRQMLRQGIQSQA